MIYTIDLLFISLQLTINCSPHSAISVVLMHKLMKIQYPKKKKIDILTPTVGYIFNRTFQKITPPITKYKIFEEPQNTFLKQLRIFRALSYWKILKK